MTTKKRSEREWRQLLEEQRDSGESQAEWCKEKGINLNTFRDRSSRLKSTVKKERPQAAGTETSTVEWVEIKPEREPATTPGIKIEHGGFSITVNPGFDSELLTDVLLTVSRVCC